MVHNHDECLENQLCSWDTSRVMCVDFNPNLPPDGRIAAKTCSNPTTIRSGSLVQVQSNECRRWVDQPASILYFDSESQSMFYHWYDFNFHFNFNFFDYFNYINFIKYL